MGHRYVLRIYFVKNHTINNNSTTIRKLLTPSSVPMALVMDLTEEVKDAGSGMSGIWVTELTSS